MTIVSLFSGAGGLDLGLIQAGNRVVWANDIAHDAVETYRRNIGDHIVEGDVRQLDFTTVPAADVIVGGFPCQGFSQANFRRTADDDRNFLYRSFRDLVRTKRPMFFLAENVKGILSMRGGAAIAEIVQDFADAGYLVEKHLVDMADYGVPQHRMRVILVGQRRDVAPEMLFRFPEPTHGKGSGQPHITIRAALDRFPDPDRPNNLPNHVYSKYKVEFRNFTGHRQTDPDKPCPTILARGNGGGGVCAIPHYNGRRRLTIRESAAIQTFPDDFVFVGATNSCYRQIGNAVPVLFARRLGEELRRLEQEERL